MKSHNTFSRILDGMILTAFLLFFSSAGFQDRSTSGWYQQFFPNMNGSSITSITFLDSLTGYATSSKNSLNQAYILKTTNGGDNWSIIFNYTPSGVNTQFRKIQFVNQSTGFVSTNDASDFFKTTNAGVNWIDYLLPVVAYDFCAINADTLLHVNSTGFGPGIFRSTNGGINWTGISNLQANSIYMYNKDMGFCLGNQMRKTTNGGVNWFAIQGESYTSIMFVDSLTGWKCYDSIKKTTNGGINWVTQKTPSFSIYFSNHTSFSILNKDTVWMVGAEKYGRPPVFKTTNGGLNWGYQFPDTTLQLYSIGFIQFVNNRVGWIYPSSIFGASLSHTTTGGNDTTFFTGIKHVPNIVPEKFSLGQNYPNPFNPTTNIPFELKEPSHVTLKVFDARGREVKELVNGRWGTGKFIADFDGTEFSTGVYFYKILLYGEKTKQTFSETKKMLMIK